ncbi:Restriction of telomere capping protein 5, partial [Mortierella sp. AD094]
MGAVHSLLNSSEPDSAAQPSARPHDPIDSQPASWICNKLHRDMAAKFSELELLSLRQVFQQLKLDQEKRTSTTKPSESRALQHLQQLQQSHLSKQAKKDVRAAPGITEPTFVEYLGFPSEKSRAGQLFFRSFCNLSVYPDNPDSLSSRGQPQNLTVKDFIKPLALFCQKVNQETLMDVKPLKVIFESFAERGAPSPALHDTAAATTSTTDATSNNINVDTDNSAPLNDQLSLKRTKTMEDSLRDLASYANFEWNPDDENTVDAGPSVKALDLIEILDGLLWLIQKIINTRSNNDPDTLQSDVSDSHLRHRATSIVEHMIQYSRSASDVLVPVDLSLELIDFGTFSKYITRNAPNLFEVLSQYFYNLFLIGNTLSLSEATAESKFILPGISPIPDMNSPSSVITPEHLALISWFLPLKKSTPSLTKLYNGSQHGFSMNQFEVHVCKYPAPTLLLLLVERQKTVAPIMNRRQSISFGNTVLRHRNSISSNSPTYSNYSTTWGSDGRKSFDKLTGRSPTTPVSTGSVLGTIFDNVPAAAGNIVAAEPNEMQSSPPARRDSLDNTPAIMKPRRLEKERLILGAYVTETWKVSKAGWGNDTFALFELSPCFEVFPARKSSSSTAPPSSAKSLPIRTAARGTPIATTPANQQNRHYIHFLKNAGVGFGGQESESCMLYMDDNLRYGSYRQDFAGGNIYMNAGGTRQSGFEIDFEIVECEVWGLGGPEAKARQKKEWDFEQREANRRASIHIRGKGDQEIDMDILEMAGVIDPDRGHRHARRQSA